MQDPGNIIYVWQYSFTKNLYSLKDPLEESESVTVDEGTLEFAELSLFTRSTSLAE